MSKTKQISEASPDRKQRLKELMKRQLTADETLNLGKVVNTFGDNNPVLVEVVLEWANEGLQRLKAITPKSEAEGVFIKMFDGLYTNVWFEKYPNSIFLFKGNPTNPDFWFEVEKSWFYCSYNRVWSFFYNEYSMKFEDIQDLIKPLVEGAFGMKGVTPGKLHGTGSGEVEGAFGMKGVTPLVRMKYQRRQWTMLSN